MSLALDPRMVDAGAPPDTFLLDGELTIKRLRITTAGVILQADNPKYPPIHVPELSDLRIWGVAVRCLHYV